MALQIMEKVVHYGAFKEALDTVVDIMRSEYASSFIIRGNAGSGKKTLISEAKKITGVRCVLIDSLFHNDDYSAMKQIVSSLGHHDTRGAHISDLMDVISSSTKGKEKLVIVLLDFEEFCRKKQSLLYNLMNLIHTNPNQIDKSLNLTLIGLTSRLDWAENIEKRVRSRLNAKCINLSYPYQDPDQFVEFASLLMDGQKISADFKEDLKYIFYFSNRSIRTLKKYLSNMCDINSRGKLVVKFNRDDWNTDYQMVPNNFFRERLNYLTRLQLDLFKLTVAACDWRKKNGVALVEVEQFALGKNYTYPITEQVLKDAALLLKLKLFKADPDQPVSENIIFYPAATPKQLKITIEGDNTLHHTATDFAWKNLSNR